MIGYLPEGAPAYGDMTARAFLRFIARVRRLPGAAAEAAIGQAVAATELSGVLDQPIDTLSKGFRRRVGLAQAILHNPPVLIMDEPTDGLDPNQKHEVRKLIGRMAADKAIIISTHILEEVDAICTRALIIDRGRVVADGTPAALTARSRYHNAVSLTVAEQLTVAAAESLKALPGIASIEIHPRGEETTFTLFPVRSGAGDEIFDEVRLVDSVARVAREQGWAVRALYGEAGRLEEVFRTLTRPAHGGRRRMNELLRRFRRELAAISPRRFAFVFIVIFCSRWAPSLSIWAAISRAGRRNLSISSLPSLALSLPHPGDFHGLWAEERRTGSIELLLSLPVPLWAAVLGKFLAAWAFSGIALALTFPM